MSPFTANMWDAYRAQCGPTWPAVSSSSSGPTLAPISDQQITAGQTLTLVLRGTGPDPAALTYSASGLPAGAAFSGQTFTWTPSATQVGTYQVTFTLSDGKYQDSKTITITVTKGNSAPVLGAIGNKSVNENQALDLHRQRHRCRWGHADLYGERPAHRGDLHGPDVHWTPTYNQAGSYNVTFTASDGQTQDSQTITITVANVDQPPVLADIGNKSVTAGQSPELHPLGHRPGRRPAHLFRRHAAQRAPP